MVIGFCWKPGNSSEFYTGVPTLRDGVFEGWLVGYVCFTSFVHGDDGDSGDKAKPSFDVADRKFGISWVMSNRGPKSGKPTTVQKPLRSVHYRGSLAHFSIPAHCVEYLTWLFRDVHRGWRELFSQSESYLDDRVGQPHLLNSSPQSIL